MTITIIALIVVVSFIKLDMRRMEKQLDIVTDALQRLQNAGTQPAAEKEGE